ncbi:MAG: hypothetical protein EU529_09055 [Promethearchaeota archaeon]|nr:MAG: hypothetical protein EU529_09055 [Candidatus Lokiarchaeota archaeon]
MVKDINIREAIMDKTSHFNIKRFKIGNLRINGPTKIIDIRDTTKDLFNRESNKFKNIILENSKLVIEDTINKVLQESDDQKIKQQFGYKEWFSIYPFIISHTFKFNPYQNYDKIEKIAEYFDYYYEFSNPFLLIPNIKIEKYISEKDKSGKIQTKKIKIINLEDYIKFVDETYDILNYKNKKPIFVPLSLKFGITDIKKLAQEFIKKEYFNIWIDFEGSAISKTKIARIRAFWRQFDEKLRTKDIVIYSTNLKREIISNKYDDESPSSDILASIIGSNIIGVNREPPRIPNRALSPEELLELKLHKARIFDSNTYYYLKLKASNLNKKQQKNLMKPNFNKIFNSGLLENEFKNQSQYFLDNNQIEGYISNKEMIQNYKDGELKRDLFHKDIKISSWF